MENYNEKKVTVTKIPLANEILKGEWSNPTYLIYTERDTDDGHTVTVRDESEKIMRDFDAQNHVSVSLRPLKSEIVWKSGERYGDQFATLVSFRVRDLY